MTKNAQSRRIEFFFDVLLFTIDLQVIDKPVYLLPQEQNPAFHSQTMFLRLHKEYKCVINIYI